MSAQVVQDSCKCGKCDPTPLTAQDRCDRCGAQAYVRTVLTGGSELLWCAHHWRENELSLLPLVAHIQNETERLTVRQTTQPE